MTHTYAILEVSPAAWTEIRGLLEKAGYQHAFHVNDGQALIDMHGIALAARELKAAEASSVPASLCNACGLSDGHESWCPMGECNPSGPASARLQAAVQSSAGAQPAVLQHQSDTQILYCRRHDFGICGKHREDCGPDRIPCSWELWPTWTSNLPSCAVCEGRLLPRDKPCPERAHEHDGGKLIFFGGAPE